MNTHRQTSDISGSARVEFLLSGAAYVHITSMPRKLQEFGVDHSSLCYTTTRRLDRRSGGAYLRGGDTHGAINRLYDDVLAFEMSLGGIFEWVLHVGDFGI